MAPPAHSAPDVVRADPQARQRAIAIVLGGGICGVVATRWLLPWAHERLAQGVYEGSLPQSVVCKSVLVGLMLVAASVVAFGVYAYRFGRRVVEQERFPPAGTKVVRNTRVVSGRAARFLGRAQAINGAMIVALGFALLALCVYGFWALS